MVSPPIFSKFGNNFSAFFSPISLMNGETVLGSFPAGLREEVS